MLSSVVINLDEQYLSNLKDAFIVSKGLHLIGFMQLDIEQYLESLGVAGSNQISYYQDEHIPAGHMIYDKLLESASANSLGIPLFKNIYFIDDGNYPEINLQPYSGPVHYHGENNCS